MEGTPMNKKVITRMAATTVNEMVEALTEMVAVHGPHSLDTTFVSINSDSVRMALVEETLTDGSKVYNIELSEVCK
jgi:hypothetical protein